MDKRYSLLVVDDVQENIQVLSNILDAHGYNLVFAKNGNQAVRVAKKKLPDLILMDVTMPELDGFSACKLLKEDVSTKEIPLIFLTARNQSQDIVEGFSLGGVDYITKPFNSEELISRVKNHIELNEARELIKTQNEELKKLNATKDKFFRIIGHDLKSPISQIIQLSDLLVNQFNDYSEEEIKSFVGYMKESSITTFKLLENLLDWARSQTNSITFNPAFTKIKCIGDECVSLLKENAIAKKITIHNNFNEEIEVKIDQNMISTVIRNLISNAVKFTNEGGTIELEANKKHDVIEISVKDNGVGMRRDDCEKLFKIESGNTSLGTNKEKGTGIGLILCREFVERHNGKIWAESEPDMGSKFTFSIPVE